MEGRMKGRRKEKQKREEETNRGWEKRQRHVCVLSHSVVSDPRDYSPPSSSVRGIFQARILEWVAIFFSKGKGRQG